jgi:hypothetical protein
VLRRVPAAIWLGLIVLAAAALRFYGLAWGAPYFHFHIDEHYVFVGAELLRHSMKAAATLPKFFMYGPLPMHMLNAGVSIHDHLWTPLNLKTFDDQVTYMVMGRAISAAMGTLTVWVIYFVAKRVAGPRAGLVAAALLATTVIHLAESHSFRVDLTMLFFVVVAWLFALRIAEHGRLSDYLWAGAAAGAAIGSKYTGAFIVGVIGVAHLLAPGRPASLRDARGWMIWTARGVSPLILCAAVFAVVNPMAITYSTNFFGDIKEQITDPLTGVSKPIWIAQFTDVQPQLYWFTTNLWWGLGPFFEVWGLVGVVALLWRRTPAAVVAAACPLIYLLIAGGTSAPMARYAMPLGPALAVSAGCLSAFALERPRWRTAGIVATALVVGATALYAIAYMNVYRSPDPRLEASRFMESHLPPDSRILVEPSHSMPPTGGYLKNPDFFGDHMLWDYRQERRDGFHLYAFDAYKYLYNRTTPDQQRAYIQSRLDLVDYIVIDDYYVQLYQHMSEAEHGVMKQYYRDLLSGALGFDLMKTFKVYPSLFGVTINDDRAELSSRMNDHPRIYIFIRRQPRTDR